VVRGSGGLGNDRRGAETGPKAAAAGRIMPLGHPRKARPSMTRIRPRFVYFDLGNVLALFDRGIAARRMAEVAGITPEAALAAAIDSGLQARLERGEIDWGEFHRAFGAATASTSDAAALAEAASDMFSLNVAILPVIGALEKAGIRTGILSNTCAPHWEHILGRRFAVIPGRFSEIVLSHEVRAAKPDGEIYRIATARAGVPAAEIFFTDDLAENIDAARAAGWDAEVFVSAPGLADALWRRGVNLAL